MRRTLTRLGRLMPLLALSALTAHAQESGMGYDFKLRYGHQVTGVNDNLQPGLMGFGVNFAYATSIGRFGVELGYQQKPGKQYQVDVTKFPITAVVNQPFPANSGDLRRNELSGLTVRLGYQWLPEKAQFGFQGGLQLGGTKFRHEYFGNTSDAASTYTDIYQGTPTKNDLGISPYAGVVIRVGENSTLECNILAQRYKSINYVHVAGTVPGSPGFHTASDYLAEESRTAVHLEVGYAFRF